MWDNIQPGNHSPELGRYSDSVHAAWAGAIYKDAVDRKDTDTTLAIMAAVQAGGFYP
jgi:hypothetical protein